MAKLTKEQIEFLEKELKELESEKNNDQVLLVIYVVVFIPAVYFSNYVVQALGISHFTVIGLGIGALIGMFIINSRLSKTKDKIKDVKFKLAGDKSWLKKESDKPKEKTELEKWREQMGVKAKEDNKKINSESKWNTRNFFKE